MKTLLLIILSIVSSYSFGQCQSFNSHTRVAQIANEINGIPPQNAIAFATWDENGNPTIIYSPRFYQLQQLTRQFVWLHECAHLSVPTSNEIQANCVALGQMRNAGLTYQDEMQIANWTMSAGPVGMQYGGSGHTFWALTLECAGHR